MLQESKDIKSGKLKLVIKGDNRIDLIEQYENIDSLQAINTQESDGTPNFYKMTNGFRELLKKLSIPIDLSETNVSLLGLISFKYRVEPETRADLRFKLKGEVKELQPA